MSLSDATWQEYTRAANIQETWIVRLYHGAAGASDFVQLSDRDFVDGNGDQVLGVVQDWGDVRRSIDLAKFVAKVDNLSITVANPVYHGVALIEELRPGATRKYLNRKVELYTEVNGVYASRMQLYNGRLRGVSWTADEITLDIEQAQPWDFLKIPDQMTDVSGVYVPILYGATGLYGGGSGTNSTPTTPAYCTDKRLFPLPVIRRENGQVIMSVLEATGTPRCHFYEQNADMFIPIVNAAEEYSEGTTTAETGVLIAADWFLRHAWKAKPTHAEVAAGWTGAVLTDQANAYDSPATNDASSYAQGWAQATYYNGALYEGAARMGFAIPFSSLTYSGLTADVRYSATETGDPTYVTIRLRTGDDSIDFENITPDGAQRTITLAISGATPPAELQLCTEVYGSYLDTATVRIYDIRIKSESKINSADDDLAQASARENVKMLYVSGFGSNCSWIAAPVTCVHELHRDILHRYCGHTTAPAGWSDLDAARRSEGAEWFCRWWLHEQKPVQEILEQAQYEGAFIFLWSMTTTGTGRYLFVKDTYSSSDVAATLDELADTQGVSYKHTPFDELVTKQVINYERHPADEGRYISSYTATNTTARTDWNIQTLENVETVELDMLTAKVDTWAGLRDNIFGDLKRIVSCDIVNPRYFILEIGDIVMFTNDTRYFMITDERRTPGRLSITAREVYA